MRRKFRDDGNRRGAALIEVLLLGSMIVLVAIGAASAMHGYLEGVFQQLTQNLPAIH